MKRRDFMSNLGGSALAWPFRGLAQPSDRKRRIGVLMSTAESDPEGRSRINALTQMLHTLGWTDGHNIQISVRWDAGEAKRAKMHAAELLALAPDLLVANAAPALLAVQRETSAIPIVFVQVADPIGGGFVTDLAHPSGNITGFTSFEDAMGAKWLQLLKELVPSITRVALLRNFGPTSTAARMMPAIDTAARAMGCKLITADVRDRVGIERAYDVFVRDSSDCVIAIPDPLFTVDRDQIIALASRHRLPAMYYFRFFATSGGLMSYGPDTTDIYQRAASYVDRILKGAQPKDLPVQQPTKFELVINLKTAKALGLTIPQSLRLRADEVIQ